MDGRLQIRLEVVVAVLLVCLVRLGEGGECCKAHYNVVGNEVSNSQKWCSNYCCFNVLKYDCCDNILLQAPANMRMGFCANWFAVHWYVPLLAVLAVIGSFICCCVCCCCACCRNRGNGTVFVPAQPQGMMIVTQQAPPADQASSQTNPFNNGYDQ